MTGVAVWENVVVAPARRAAGLGRLLRRTLGAAVEHDDFLVAQATAYSATVALFPALIVAAAAVALLPPWLPLKVQMAGFFDRVLPSNVSPLLDAYFATTHHTSRTAGALLASGVVSLLGAASVMATLMEGFRRAHELPVLSAGFLRRRGRALVLVPLSLLPMTAASVLVVFGHLLIVWLAREIPPFAKPGFYALAVALRWAVALGTSVSIIAVVYHLGTDLTQQVREHLEPMVREPWVMLRRDWSWRASLPGAALATLLWFASTLLFGFYVTRFANYGRVYGSLGAAIALMVWLYMIALTVLIGAEFNAQWSASRRDPALEAALWKSSAARRRRTGRMAD
ncbi:MAG TPA: YihY/virulence factor BrkB family protein [Acidobacteriaceae bacterium]|nr:YihY/virulence factor BrkB family protein [Acidobacteriaceae bacterium]